jgi:DNA-binding NarL/FixJ family response regulator
VKNLEELPVRRLQPFGPGIEVRMAIVIAVAGAGDIVAGGLCQILEQAPDLEVLYDFPHFGILPDVVLYDVGGMQDDGGEQLTRLLGEQDATVVVVGRDLRPDLATRALAQGAVAWVSLEAPAS